jgi:hypothetical protein
VRLCENGKHKWRVVASRTQSSINGMQPGDVPISHRRTVVILAYFLSPPHAGLSFGDDKRDAEERGDRRMQRSRSGRSSFLRQHLWVGAVAALLALPVPIARADEGGVSFWIPGFLAASRRSPRRLPAGR